MSLGIIPLTMAIARQWMPEHLVRPAVAALSVTVVTGSGLGFPLTGYIADHHGYRATFWIGVALAAPTAAAVALVVPRSPGADRGGFALVESVLLAAGLGLVLLAVSQATVWSWPALAGCAVAGTALFACWVWRALRSPRPLVDLRLSTARPVLAANTAAFFLGIGMYLSTSLAVHIAQAPPAQAGLGASVTATGLLILPLSLASLLANQLTRAVLGRRSPILGLATAVAGVAACEVLLALNRGSLVAVAVAMAVLGVALGTAFALMPFVVLAHVPTEETGGAMSLNLVLRHLGGAVGSAGGIGIATAVGEGTAHGYTAAFAVAAALSGAAAGYVLLTVLVRTGLGRHDGAVR
ncbi:hypothetical protein Psuf_072920 [Phytohabitans suffuscus]|uniref:Major facilitator superfamily (MFS) profile domain-containing protein n=1 Tax=Phytohabitans suffuscus TaxID=624315 RepID=A0A6F8YV75_9ACTN|nr:MFS transporter [Phytohabitans suffuscus]BCB89979.1 hypothetical protein Psuf_072920 [Phytohabitans suffuscus]